jgi:hypothetical protein
MSSHDHYKVTIPCLLVSYWRCSESKKTWHRWTCHQAGWSSRIPLVHLIESGFDLCGPLVIALKPHLDLPSGSTIGDSLELLKRKTREKNCASSAISVVPIFLILRDTSMGFKHNIGSILVNLPDKPINPLKIREHADLPIGVVCSIEEWWFAGTTLHVAFMDHDRLKCNYSLLTLIPIEGPKTMTRGEGEWKPQISFETFDHCPKINPQKAHKQKLQKLELPRVKRT